MFKEMDKIVNKFFKENDKFINKMKNKCEECEETFTNKYDNESIKKTGVCVDCGKKLFK